MILDLKLQNHRDTAPLTSISQRRHRLPTAENERVPKKTQNTNIY